MAAQSQPPQEFQVMVFAGIRGWIAELKEASAAEFSTAQAAKCKEALDSLLSLITDHMKQEDEARMNGTVFFGVLDRHFESVVAKNNLRDEHTNDLVGHANLRAALDASIAAGDFAQFRAAVDSFGTEHIAHLEHEEKVMMPLTMKIPAPQRVGCVHAILTSTAESLPTLAGLSSSQIAKRNPYPTLRMHVAAMKRALTKEQYAPVREAVKLAVGGEKWAMLEGHGLGGDGEFAQEKDGSGMTY
ncbi:hypothetical protein HDU93_003699 [Gonapodya sp. JEL0774]|nr:hypothetical protein HDU93_003699 [Gonapodya sp. JEL0774]